MEEIDVGGAAGDADHAYLGPVTLDVPATEPHYYAPGSAQTALWVATFQAYFPGDDTIALTVSSFPSRVRQRLKAMLSSPASAPHRLLFAVAAADYHVANGFASHGSVLEVLALRGADVAHIEAAAIMCRVVAIGKTGLATPDGTIAFTVLPAPPPPLPRSIVEGGRHHAVVCRMWDEGRRVASFLTRAERCQALPRCTKATAPWWDDEAFKAGGPEPPALAQPGAGAPASVAALSPLAAAAAATVTAGAPATAGGEAGAFQLSNADHCVQPPPPRVGCGLAELWPRDRRGMSLAEQGWSAARIAAEWRRRHIDVDPTAVGHWFASHVPMGPAYEWNMLTTLHPLARLQSALKCLRAHARFNCARCGRTVTRCSNVMAMCRSGVSNTFVNPHGVVSRVLTARAVLVGATAVAGPPTLDATWYAGYAWSILSCVRCRSHLGWRYDWMPPGTPAVRVQPTSNGSPPLLVPADASASAPPSAMPSLQPATASSTVGELPGGGSAAAAAASSGATELTPASGSGAEPTMTSQQWSELLAFLAPRIDGFAEAARRFAASDRSRRRGGASAAPQLVSAVESPASATAAGAASAASTPATATSATLDVALASAFLVLPQPEGPYRLHRAAALAAPLDSTAPPSQTPAAATPGVPPTATELGGRFRSALEVVQSHEAFSSIVDAVLAGAPHAELQPPLHAFVPPPPVGMPRTFYGLRESAITTQAHEEGVDDDNEYEDGFSDVDDEDAEDDEEDEVDDDDEYDDDEEDDDELLDDELLGFGSEHAGDRVDEGDETDEDDDVV